VIIDIETSKSRDFGFIEIPNESEANTAINKLNGFAVQGRYINVIVIRKTVFIAFSNAWLTKPIMIIPEQCNCA
jgi:hypothetical protein